MRYIGVRVDVGDLLDQTAGSPGVSEGGQSLWLVVDTQATSGWPVAIARVGPEHLATILTALNNG